MAVASPSNNQTNSTTTKVLYQTKPHKPNDPEERARLEHVDGVTVKSEHDNEEARVWYRSEIDGRTYGLAMSRAMGDHDANGILAEPTIDILDLLEIQKEMQTPPDVTVTIPKQCVATNNDDNPQTATTNTCDYLDDAGTDTSHRIKDWELWVVSVTDGIMDVMSPEEIAKQLLSFTSTTSTKLVSAERLLYQASSRWIDLEGPDYRDDMAIAMMRISGGDSI
jgi:hypothetical protein